MGQYIGTSRFIPGKSISPTVFSFFILYPYLLALYFSKIHDISPTSGGIRQQILFPCFCNTRPHIFLCTFCFPSLVFSLYKYISVCGDSVLFQQDNTNSVVMKLCRDMHCRWSVTHIQDAVSILKVGLPGRGSAGLKAAAGRARMAYVRCNRGVGPPVRLLQQQRLAYDQQLLFDRWV